MRVGIPFQGPILPKWALEIKIKPSTLRPWCLALGPNLKEAGGFISLLQNINQY